MRKSDSSGSEYQRKACCHSNAGKYRCRISGVGAKVQQVSPICLFLLYKIKLETHIFLQMCLSQNKYHCSYSSSVKLNIDIQREIWSELSNHQGPLLQKLNMNSCIPLNHFFFLVLGVSFPHIFKRIHEKAS